MHFIIQGHLLAFHGSSTGKSTTAMTDAYGIKWYGTEVGYMVWYKSNTYHITHTTNHTRSQAFDVSGVSEYTVASNMVRNRIFYIEIRSIVSHHRKYGF